MAASQNPIQGSLFGSNEHSNIHEKEEINNSKKSNQNLSNQQLKDDALLRPRLKKTSKNLNKIIKENNIDFTVLNGENSADDGKGITNLIAEEFFQEGVDVITSGNHIWDKKETTDYIEKENSDSISDLNIDNIDEEDDVNTSENLPDIVEDNDDSQMQALKTDEPSVRRLSLFDNISVNSSEKSFDETEKTEPVISENLDEIETNDSVEIISPSEQVEPEFNASNDDDLDEEYNQETEEELLDIPTFLRRQAN